MDREVKPDYHHLMARWEKVLYTILRGAADQNIDFKELCGLLHSMGFGERIHGDHHIYFQSSVTEIINIQPVGAKAKPYQVKQVRNLIVKYKLGETL